MANEPRELRLAGIRERESKAAEGPFHVEHNEIRNEYGELIADVEYEGDAHFFAHARADIPYLLSALDSERERVLLEAAKAQCWFCRAERFYTPAEKKELLWQHEDKNEKGRIEQCRAAAIHDLRSRGESR